VPSPVCLGHPSLPILDISVPRFQRLRSYLGSGQQSNVHKWPLGGCFTVSEHGSGRWTGVVHV